MDMGSAVMDWKVRAMLVEQAGLRLLERADKPLDSDGFIVALYVEQVRTNHLLQELIHLLQPSD